MEVCMDNNLSIDCQEILIAGEEEIFVPVNNDAIEVVLSLFTADNPDSALLSMPIAVPNFDRQQITEQGTMPITVAEATGFILGDSFYLCGGYTESENEITADFWRYNFPNQEWTQLDDYPGGPQAFMTSSVIGDLAYVGTGGDGSRESGSNEFYSYNAMTDVWTRLADLPFGAQAGVSFALNDKIYMTNLIVNRDGNSSRNVFEYDVSRDSWRTLRQFPFQFTNNRNMAVVYDGTAYVINTLDDIIQITRYDQERDDWGLVEEFAISCDDGVAFTQDDALYITTGRGMDGLYRFDLATFESSLSCTTTQEMRSEAVGAVYNGEVFIFGGLEHDLDPSNFTQALNTVYSLEL